MSELIKTAEWKAFVARFAMPAVEPCAVRVECTNCGKSVSTRPIYNLDELETLDGFLCENCR